MTERRSEIRVGRCKLMWRLFVEPRDMWLGVFWKTKNLGNYRRFDVFICAVPCVPLKLSLVTYPRKPR